MLLKVSEIISPLLQDISLRTVLISVILTFVIKIFFDAFRKDPRLVDFAATIPGPPALPIIGNLWQFYRRKYALEIFKWEKKYGSRFRIWLGKHLAVAITDAEDLQVVFGSRDTFEKPEIFVKPFQNVFGLGIFTASKSIWRKSRGELQQYFRHNVLAKSIPEINRVIQRHLKEMEKLADGREFDILDRVILDMSFDITTKALFGFEIESHVKNDMNFQFPGQVATSDEITHLKTFRPWEQTKLFEYFKWRKLNDKYKEESAKLIDLVLERTSTGSSTSPSKKNVSTSAFLQSLRDVAQDAQLGENYVKDEITILSGTGTDFPAFTLAWVITAVAMYPKVQAKLYDELYQRFGDDNRAADYTDIGHLPYLDQVIKESQRLFMSSFVLFRKVVQDSKIGSYTYPAGTIIVIPVLNVHMNSKLYPSPSEFNPENFSREAVSKRLRSSFLSFGTGTRYCMGKNLAELGIKLMLIALMRKFSFQTTMEMKQTTDDDPVPHPSVKGHAGDFYVSIKLRKEESN